MDATNLRPAILECNMEDKKVGRTIINSLVNSSILRVPRRTGLIYSMTRPYKLAQFPSHRLWRIIEYYQSRLRYAR